MSMMIWFLLALISFAAVPAVAAERVRIRVGHFPNLTHAQAIVAHGLNRQGKGWFEARLGPDVDVQ